MCAHPPDHPLVRSFLHEIAVPFGDRNPKGSITRLFNILAHASLEEEEAVLCLVRAYTIARDTRTIRSVHSEPGISQANRMPLFCTLFERFVQARLHNDKWNYSCQQMEEDVAADDRLLLWWAEHQGLLTSRIADPSLQTPVAQDTLENQRPGVTMPLGWVRREAAHAWGEQLLEALIAAGYESEVRVHLEDQWYQLVVLAEREQYILGTSQDVKYIITSISGNTTCNQ